MTTDNNTLQDLARALDQAISSNSPAVRKQFEQLMVLLALTQTADDPRRLPGPFEQMIQNVESLARRCEQLEQRLLQVEINKNTYHNPYTIQPGTSPGYGAIPGGPFTYTTNTSIPVGGTITLTGGTSLCQDTISLGDYNYGDNTMLTGAAGSDILTSRDIDQLIEQMSITINKEKKNA